MRVLTFILKKISFNNLNLNSICINSFQQSLIMFFPLGGMIFFLAFIRDEFPGLNQISSTSRVGGSPPLLLCYTVKQCLRFACAEPDSAKFLRT